MTKIAIVGPESSGKTTLCEALMLQFDAGLVVDGSREFLETLERPYVEGDLLEMAQDHAAMFNDAPLFAAEYEQAVHGDEAPGPYGELTLFDTDILNYRIWSAEKYGRVHAEIDRLVLDLKYDLRLLCRPDMPWEPDPLRENPHDRDRLFGIWEREMQSLGFPYMIIEGPFETRVHRAALAIEALLRGSGS